MTRNETATTGMDINDIPILLRRKIEADPKQPRYLQTVRGEGYMLAPD